MLEEWRDVKGYEGLYHVSDLGRVRSHVLHRKDGRILSARASQVSPYPTVHLRKDGQGESALVHRLVAKAFIPNPLNKPIVNHKDSNRTNNHVSNLEWATRSEDECHAIKAGRVPFGKGENHARAVFSDKVVQRIRELGSKGWIQQEIADTFGASQSYISMILSGKIRKLTN